MYLTTSTFLFLWFTRTSFYFQMELISTWLLTLLLVVMVFISVTGNVLVVMAVKTDKTLRKLSNLFLVSLAIADLLVTLTFTKPSSLTFSKGCDICDALCHYQWYDGRMATWGKCLSSMDQVTWSCSWWGSSWSNYCSSDVMCSTASILSLCVISLDRYIRVKDPLQYTQWITRK